MLITVLLLVVHLYVATGSQPPLAYWSMDKYQDKTLLPDIGDPAQFSCDLSRIEEGKVSKEPGVNGSALFINRQDVKIVQKLEKQLCVRDPAKCQDGLTISFWLNVEEYTYRRYQVIARTTTATLKLPGFYIGDDPNDENVLQFRIQTSSGKLYRASIPRSLNLNNWTHTGFRWNQDGIEVFINGTVLTASQYVLQPMVQNISVSRPTNYYMMLGNALGPRFKIDDLKIYHSYLTDENIANLFVLPSQATQPMSIATSPLSTTTVKETPTTKTTSASTTAPPTTSTTSSTSATTPTTRTTWSTSTTTQTPTTSATTSTTTRKPTTTSTTKSTTMASTEPTPPSSTSEPVSTTKQTTSTEVSISTTTKKTVVATHWTFTTRVTAPELPTLNTTAHTMPPIQKTTTTEKVVFHDIEGAVRFYEQTWFVAIVAITIAILVGSCIGLYVYYCCCKEEDKEEKAEEEELQPMSV